MPFDNSPRKYANQAERDRLAALYPWTEEMDEMSGLHGAYEDACRWLMRSAVEWLQQHPSMAASILSGQGQADAALFAKAIGPLEAGCSGAMLDTALNHSLYVHKQGWDAYVTLLSHRKKEIK